MKLLIRRNQKPGMIKGMKYILYVRAQLTEEENELVKKNNLTSELLYYYDKDAGKSGLSASMKAAGGLAGALLSRMRDTALTVGSLAAGTEITCDNVAELLGVEDQVKDAALMLKAYLDCARSFGGEEVLDMDKILAEKYGKG